MEKIIVSGDYSPRFQLADLVEEKKYENIFHSVIPHIQNCDYSIVNFETVVVEDNNAKAIEKCGPALRTTEKGVEALAYAGFSCVTLANNHFGDYGNYGVDNTLQYLKKHHLEYVGGGMNICEAEKTLFKRIKGRMYAIINACEHEFTIATKEKAGAAPLDIPTIVHSIIEAKKKADYIIVIIHGGNEFYQLPTPRMKKTYRCFIECGADVVINHHQHCFSGYEIYQDKPIFYGIGNFCFASDKFSGLWNEGYMVELTFNNNNLSFQIIPYSQFSDGKTIEIYNNTDKEKVFSKIKRLNEIISDDAKLEEEYRKFMPSCFPGMRMSITPYTARIPYSLCLRHLIPSFITKERKKLLYAYINCESHRDIFLEYLKAK